MINSILSNRPADRTVWLWMVALAAFLLVASLPCPTPAQDEYPDRIIAARIQAAVIDSVTRVLNEAYVYPDVAVEVERYVRRQLGDKVYEGITSAVTSIPRSQTHHQN